MNKNGNYRLCLSVFYCTVIPVGKPLGKNLDRKSFPRTVREQDQYSLGFGGMRITFTVYRTGHLNRSCLGKIEILALSALFNLMERREFFFCSVYVSFCSVNIFFVHIENG
jgi:hypothetical protein